MEYWNESPAAQAAAQGEKSRSELREKFGGVNPCDAGTPERAEDFPPPAVRRAELESASRAPRGA